MGLALRVGHCFSLVPARTRAAAPPWFSWRSLRAAYAIAVLLAVAARAIISWATEDALLVILGDTAAHSVAVLIAATYLRLGVRWGAFVNVFHQMEKARAIGDRHPPGLGHRMHKMTVCLLCVALAEHTFDRASLFTTTLAKYPSLWYFLDDCFYKPPFLKALSTVFFHAVASLLGFMYLFNDMFIMLVSVYVAAHVQNFNRHLDPTLTKAWSDVYWEQARHSYDELSKLIKQIDGFINTNVFISFTQNLFFICFQLYYFFRLTEDTVQQKLFRISSFVYVAMRAYAVAFFAARINDYSKVARTMLFSVSSRSYCKEVQRFILQAASEEMALSGCNFFRVTRAFILTVAGTIATYEVVLLQMNKSNSQ